MFEPERIYIKSMVCKAFFGLTRLKDGSLYCPGTYNLKAPIMSPKQFGLYKK